MSQPTIYLCYHPQQTIIPYLYTALSDLGLPVFMDSRDGRAAFASNVEYQLFLHRLELNILRYDFFVVALSPTTLTHPRIRREIRLALWERRRIVALQIDGYQLHHDPNLPDTLSDLPRQIYALFDVTTPSAILKQLKSAFRSSGYSADDTQPSNPISVDHIDGAIQPHLIQPRRGWRSYTHLAGILGAMTLLSALNWATTPPQSTPTPPPAPTQSITPTASITQPDLRITALEEIDCHHLVIHLSYNGAWNTDQPPTLYLLPWHEPLTDEPVIRLIAETGAGYRQPLTLTPQTVHLPIMIQALQRDARDQVHLMAWLTDGAQHSPILTTAHRCTHTR